MSTSNIPKISVTTDSHRRGEYEHHSTTASSESENSSNDMDYNQNLGGLTDAEDFDSGADVERSHSRKSSRNSLNIANGLIGTQDDVTDVEDYNDSEAEEANCKSVNLPDLKLSLNEFLRNDCQEHFSISNGNKEIVRHKVGDFLKAQNLNLVTDYLTDCEDFNTDSEIENKFEKSACVDLKEVYAENINIADSTNNSKTKRFECSDCDNDDTSIVSSCAVSALSDFNGKELLAVSEDEMIELSSNEEVCQFSCSESDSISNISDEGLIIETNFPPIDVTFMHLTKMPSLNNDRSIKNTSSKVDLGKMLFLEVEGKRKEEVLTDTERFDDSVEGSIGEDSFDDDDDNLEPIPKAVIMAIGDDGLCITDCEDLICDEISEAAGPALTVDFNLIPHPQREFVILQEDKFGDTVTNVMPMDSQYQFGIYRKSSDDCITDTEEYSCSDDGNVQLLLTNFPSRSLVASPQNILVESDVTVANELLKTQQSKRSEILSNAESVTDVEEIYMAGTSTRKKKLKSRSINKNKSKFLETQKPYFREDAGTDIEDMDLSESGLLTAHKSNKKIDTNSQLNQSFSEIVTDVEEITSDDISSPPEDERPLAYNNNELLEEYENNSKNMVVSLETCRSVIATKHNNHNKSYTSKFLAEINLISNQNMQQQLTDVEDIQLPSDSEEFINISVPTADCVCLELTDMLNESCTTVHEKCVNSFDIDAEKLNIKGMLRETYTDIEYVESDESAAKGGK